MRWRARQNKPQGRAEASTRPKQRPEKTSRSSPQHQAPSQTPETPGSRRESTSQTRRAAPSSSPACRSRPPTTPRFRRELPRAPTISPISFISPYLADCGPSGGAQARVPRRVRALRRARRRRRRPAERRGVVRPAGDAGHQPGATRIHLLSSDSPPRLLASTSPSIHLSTTSYTRWMGAPPRRSGA